MGKLTKNQKSVASKIEAGKAYTLKEASQLVKDITTTKFDASVDIDVRLGVDPRKANQMVRGVVSLPNGTGKVVRVLALCTPDQEAAAKEAGADYVGFEEYIEKIKGGWTDIDVIITQNTAKRTKFTHEGRLGDDDINVSPTTLDLLDVLLKTYIVSTSLLGSCLLIRSAESKNSGNLTCTVRKRYDATDHLVGLTGINTKTNINVN